MLSNSRWVTLDSRLLAAAAENEGSSQNRQVDERRLPVSGLLAVLSLGDEEDAVPAAQSSCMAAANLAAGPSFQPLGQQNAVRQAEEIFEEEARKIGLQKCNHTVFAAENPSHLPSRSPRAHVSASANNQAYILHEQEHQGSPIQLFTLQRCGGIACSERQNVKSETKT